MRARRWGSKSLRAVEEGTALLQGRDARCKPLDVSHDLRLAAPLLLVVAVAVGFGSGVVGEPLAQLLPSIMDLLEVVIIQHQMETLQPHLRNQELGFAGVDQRSDSLAAGPPLGLQRRSELCDCFLFGGRLRSLAR